MSNPLDKRVSPRHPGGGYSPSGVSELLRQFASPDSAKAYSEWADHPITKLVRKALTDMALNGIPDRDEESIAVQHGLTLGLGAAAQMLEDAALVIPGMFAAGQHSRQLQPEETFSVSPSDALDNLK